MTGIYLAGKLILCMLTRPWRTAGQQRGSGWPPTVISNLSDEAGDETGSVLIQIGGWRWKNIEVDFTNNLETLGIQLPPRVK